MPPYILSMEVFMTIKQLKQHLPSIKDVIGLKETDLPKEKEKVLIQAFIRRSYSQEHPEWQHNQILEFIGDSVLDAYIVRLFCSPTFNNYDSFNTSGQFSSTKTEGELTKLKEQYVKSESLAKHIDNLKLAQYLILGRADEKNQVQNKQASKEDLFEAIIGAVALACNFNNDIIDSVCSTMLELGKSSQKKQSTEQRILEMRKLVGDEKTITSKNAVSKLLLLNQKKFISVPKYSYNNKIEYDENNNPLWKCSCKIEGYKYDYYCSGKSKKEARQRISIYILKFILGYEKN